MTKFRLTSGAVPVTVTREGESASTEELVSALDFGLEDGSGFSKDRDGVNSYNGIFKAFGDEFTVVLVCEFVEHELRTWELSLENKTVRSAILNLVDEDLQYELEYGDL